MTEEESLREWADQNEITERAVSDAIAERDARIAQRDMLLKRALAFVAEYANKGWPDAFALMMEIEQIIGGCDERTGKELYASGDRETREWFERQWKVWPERADPCWTTNFAFHLGGIAAYRAENGRDPAMSESLFICVSELEEIRGHDDRD